MLHCLKKGPEKVLYSASERQSPVDYNNIYLYWLFLMIFDFLHLCHFCYQWVLSEQSNVGGKSDMPLMFHDQIKFTHS